MKIHILGVCGTFMGGIARIARELGHEVAGSDQAVYPPMSTQLEQSGVSLTDGYHAASLDPAPDLVVVGNALSRGNACIEYLLNEGLAYRSGPQWLAEQVLQDRWVLAVSGTHGKTTTASILAWILEDAGHAPGFLIGGVPSNFNVTARLGRGRYFVVEADEYDTAFFDKRSKFIHYRPRTLVMTNIEFDHADIFPDLDAIKRQFHHLIRIIPSRGLLIRPAPDPVIDEVLTMGCWTPVETFGPERAEQWGFRDAAADFSAFDVTLEGCAIGRVVWELLGQHNALNALAALAAARHAGVAPDVAIGALSSFAGVKRRLEQLGVLRGVSVYDDFAHHPTEIRATIAALRQRVGPSRIIAVFEPRSNSMRQGAHAESLADAFSEADFALFYWPPELGWDLDGHTRSLGSKRILLQDLDAIVAKILALARPADQVLIMSNGGFGGLHQKLLHALGSGGQR
ncbi:MAG: UDP-N-acetylmuramate:L-alanyl-gamma-D-glutamyl-meso-diaminopimelate ligase [Gammaproteobacteria bacterium]